MTTVRSCMAVALGCNYCHFGRSTVSPSLDGSAPAIFRLRNTQPSMSGSQHTTDFHAIHRRTQRTFLRQCGPIRSRLPRPTAPRLASSSRSWASSSSTVSCNGTTRRAHVATANTRRPDSASHNRPRDVSGKRVLVCVGSEAPGLVDSGGKGSMWRGSRRLDQDRPQVLALQFLPTVIQTGRCSRLLSWNCTAVDLDVPPVVCVRGRSPLANCKDLLRTLAASSGRGKSWTYRRASARDCNLRRRRRMTTRRRSATASDMKR